MVERYYRDPSPIEPIVPEYDKNDADPRVLNYTKQLREKLNGVDVRESLARTAEITSIVAKEANVTAEEAIAITKSLLDGTFDDAELATAIEEKLNQLEQEYAPRLISVEGELEKTSVQLEQTTTKLAVEELTRLNNDRTILGGYKSYPDYLNPIVNNTEVQGIVSGKFQGFPCFEITNTNKMIAIFRQASGHSSYDGILVQKESIDGGLTWSNEKVIFEEVGKDLRDPNIIKASDGSLILKYIVREENDTLTHYPKAARSIDEGETWTIVGDLPRIEGASTTTYSSRGSLTKLPSGRILCPIYCKGGNRTGSYLVYSDDNGLNWSFLSWIAEGFFYGGETAICYHSIHDEITAVIRELAYDGYKQKLFYCKSVDGGLTFTEPVALGIYGHCPIILEYENDYVLMFRNTDTENTRNNLFGQHLVTFRDGVKSTIVPIYESNTHDLGYADGRITGDNLDLVYYNANGARILFKRFNISALKNVSLFSHRENLTQLDLHPIIRHFNSANQRFENQRNVRIFTGFVNVRGDGTSKKDFTITVEPYVQLLHANCNVWSTYADSPFIANIHSHDTNTNTLTGSIRRLDTTFAGDVSVMYQIVVVV